MASEHMVYDGDAESVSLMTTEGSIGILAHHSNLIMAVVPGIVEYVPAGEDAKAAGLSGKQVVVVSDGLLKVENNEVMILVDTAEHPDDIDEARAKRGCSNCQCGAFKSDEPYKGFKAQASLIERCDVK